MARGGMIQRVDALEQGAMAKFTGYASIWRFRGQTDDQAREAWELENGPVGSRQIIFWNAPWPAGE